jgi:hypothetical protein
VAIATRKSGGHTAKERGGATHPYKMLAEELLGVVVFVVFVVSEISTRVALVIVIHAEMFD